MHEWMISYFKILVMFVFIKSIILGSDFNFYLWYKHGKKYWGWYDNRQSFTEYLEERNKESELTLDPIPGLILDTSKSEFFSLSNLSRLNTVNLDYLISIREDKVSMELIIDTLKKLQTHHTSRFHDTEELLIDLYKRLLTIPPKIL